MRNLNEVLLTDFLTLFYEGKFLDSAEHLGYQMRPSLADIWVPGDMDALGGTSTSVIPNLNPNAVAGCGRKLLLALQSPRLSIGELTGGVYCSRLIRNCLATSNANHRTQNGI